MTKKSLVAKLVILIILFFVVAALCAMCVGVINGTWHGLLPVFHFETGSGTPELVLTKQFDSESFSALNISSASTDISVSTGGDCVEIRYYSNSVSEKTEPRLTINENGSTLSVIKNDSSFFGFVSSEKYIEVSVPEDYFADYDLSSASGDINFSANAKSCNITSVSGDVICSSDNADSVGLNTTSGNIRCAASAPKIKLKTTSGDMKSTVPAGIVSASSVSGEISVAADGNSTLIETDTVSGDTSVSLIGVNDYQVDFSTVSGDLSDSVSNRESEHSTSYSIGDGALSISAESVSGDIDID